MYQLGINYNISQSFARLKYQYSCYNVIQMERDYNYVKNKVTKHGNGAKVLVPKQWVDKEVVIIPLDVFMDAQLESVMKGRRFRVLRGRRKK
jgi:putative transposon-encoded protein